MKNVCLFLTVLISSIWAELSVTQSSISQPFQTVYAAEEVNGDKWLFYGTGVYVQDGTTGEGVNHILIDSLPGEYYLELEPGTFFIGRFMRRPVLGPDDKLYFMTPDDYELWSFDGQNFVKVLVDGQYEATHLWKIDDNEIWVGSSNGFYTFNGSVWTQKTNTTGYWDMQDENGEFYTIQGDEITKGIDNVETLLTKSEAYNWMYNNVKEQLVWPVPDFKIGRVWNSNKVVVGYLDETELDTYWLSLDSNGVITLDSTGLNAGEVLVQHDDEFLVNGSGGWYSSTNELLVLNRNQTIVRRDTLYKSDSETHYPSGEYITSKYHNASRQSSGSWNYATGYGAYFSGDFWSPNDSVPNLTIRKMYPFTPNKIALTVENPADETFGYILENGLLTRDSSFDSLSFWLEYPQQFQDEKVYFKRAGGDFLVAEPGQGLRHLVLLDTINTHFDTIYVQDFQLIGDDELIVLGANFSSAYPWIYRFINGQLIDTLAYRDNIDFNEITRTAIGDYSQKMKYVSDDEIYVYADSGIIYWDGVQATVIDHPEDNVLYEEKDSFGRQWKVTSDSLLYEYQGHWFDMTDEVLSSGNIINDVIQMADEILLVEVRPQSSYYYTYYYIETESALRITSDLHSMFDLNIYTKKGPLGSMIFYNGSNLISVEANRTQDPTLEVPQSIDSQNLTLEVVTGRYQVYNSVGRLEAVVEIQGVAHDEVKSRLETLGLRQGVYYMSSPHHSMSVYIK